MQMKRTLVALATVTAVLGGIAITSVPAMAEEKLIKIDGSSTVFPITEAVAEEFQKARKGAVNVTVGISGTGGGFKKFCRSETDISDASRPILKKEMDACKQAGIEYYELPVAYDALTVMVNPKNDWIKSMTVAELKTIWGPEARGKIPGGARSTRNGRMRRSSSTAPARIRARSTTSPRRLSENRRARAAISPRARTTTCWCRASPTTRTRWVISASRTMPKTRTS